MEIPKNDLCYYICTYMSLCDSKKNYGPSKSLYVKSVNTLCNKEKFSNVIFFILKDSKLSKYHYLNLLYLFVG